MRSPYIDLMGRRFGALTVIDKLKSNKQGQTRWLCLCDCGNRSQPLGQSLRNGRIKSCGCMNKTNATGRAIHGMARTPEYYSWYSMIGRCTNVNDDNWARYGGRGITVCDRWKKSFEDFLSDMGPRPKGKTLDRINNNKGYEPGNCRWATWNEQARNKRTTIRFCIFGIMASAADWIEHAGGNYDLVMYRVKRGIDPAVALGVEDLNIAWG